MTAQLASTQASHVDWAALTSEQIHEVIRDGFNALADREPDVPTPGVLQRSVLLEDTLRAGAAVQYRYLGLVADGFNDLKLRHTLDLPDGKTAFRDAKDLLAKTHGIRANDASARLRLATALTPARASDPERVGDVGQTRLPLLGALQGRINPSKLSSALAMIDEVEATAKAAGKDEAYRAKLLKVVEQDLFDRIEDTTPEEFSRYVGRRKRDLLASLDPPDKKFSARQSESMHDVRRIGPVRGNQNAVEWRIVADAEIDEQLQTMFAAGTNPRGKDDTDSEFDTRSRGQRYLHFLRGALSFVLANFDKTGFRGASGAHTQMLVLTDYATLLEGLRREYDEFLPDIPAEQRQQLLYSRAAALTDPDDPDPVSSQNIPLRDIGEELFSRPKTTNVDDILGDQNLDRLQDRVAQGVYNNYIPPDVILRMRCDVGMTPVTLSGKGQVLSVGRQRRQFDDAMRRAIIARDRGCAVPGCHMPASMCEVHHVDPWSRGGDTSTDNGVLLCSHHHQAVHAHELKIVRLHGEFQFVLHPLIDPDQRPQRNYFHRT